MDERLLVNMALVTSCIGLVGLLVIATFQQSEFSSPQEEMLTSMDVTIAGVYFTQEGTIVTFALEQSGYIDTTLSKDLIGSTTRLTGRLEGDFFSVESIEVLEPNAHS